MNRSPQPLVCAPLSAIRAVFSDVDGTLTTQGALCGSTLDAIEALRRAGIRVVLVTGRPSGWGECWARSLPVDGVVAENGGLYFTRRGGAIAKRYAQPPLERRLRRAQLARALRATLRKVPEARLSMDSAATEVDLAIDYNEDAHLGPLAVDALERLLRARGVTAVRSSVHINCWIGPFDKLRTVQRYVRQEWALDFARAQKRFVYVGDSLNDAPMFGGFTHSVGVANVREVWDRLPVKPAFITRRPGGRGFEEVASAILRQRGRR